MAEENNNRSVISQHGSWPVVWISAGVGAVLAIVLYILLSRAEVAVATILSSAFFFVSLWPAFVKIIPLEKWGFSWKRFTYTALLSIPLGIIGTLIADAYNEKANQELYILLGIAVIFAVTAGAWEKRYHKPLTFKSFLLIGIYILSAVSVGVALALVASILFLILVLYS